MEDTSVNDMQQNDIKQYCHNSFFLLCTASVSSCTHQNLIKKFQLL
jgi:hypothetical protein